MLLHNPPLNLGTRAGLQHSLPSPGGGALERGAASRRTVTRDASAAAEGTGGTAPPAAGPRARCGVWGAGGRRAGPAWPHAAAARLPAWAGGAVPNLPAGARRAASQAPSRCESARRSTDQCGGRPGRSEDGRGTVPARRCLRSYCHGHRQQQRGGRGRKHEGWPLLPTLLGARPAATLARAALARQQQSREPQLAVLPPYAAREVSRRPPPGFGAWARAVPARVPLPFAGMRSCSTTS